MHGAERGVGPIDELAILVAETAARIDDEEQSTQRLPKSQCFDERSPFTSLALGHLSGRYPDLEEMVDMLVLVTRGTRLVRELAERESPATG